MLLCTLRWRWNVCFDYSNLISANSLVITRELDTKSNRLKCAALKRKLLRKPLKFNYVFDFVFISYPHNRLHWAPGRGSWRWRCDPIQPKVKEIIATDIKINQENEGFFSFSFIVTNYFLTPSLPFFCDSRRRRKITDNPIPNKALMATNHRTMMSSGRLMTSSMIIIEL